MANLEFAPRALLDLNEIADYLLRERGRQVAGSVARAFEDQFERLIAFPGVGAARPRLGHNIRLAIVHPYLILHVHEIGSDRVRILRVLHGSRRITRRLLRGID